MCSASFDYRETDLDLLSAPASISVAHVARRLNGWDEFHNDVRDTSEKNKASGDVIDGEPLQAQAADKDVEDSTTHEAEQERGISRQVGRDLGKELKTTHGKAEDDGVKPDDDGSELEFEKDQDTREDHANANHHVGDAKDIAEIHLKRIVSQKGSPWNRLR